MKKIKILFFSLFIQFTLHASEYLKTLTNVYKQDEFRIYYALEGENALPINNKVDENHNGVPDYVENIANQLSEASKLLTGHFGFIHPLNQPRFKPFANNVDIHLISMKVNGAASDTVDKENKSIVIKLSVNLIPNTLTPLHEFFHSIQYGYSMFNNRWSMEGQSRWVEYAFRKGTGNYVPLPKNIAEIENLTHTIYESSTFWERLAYLTDKHQGVFDYKSKYKNIFTGEYWIADDRLYGYEIIKSVLKNYQIYDKKVSEKYHYERYGWSEQEQKSDNNNPYIMIAIQKSLKELNSTNEEINNFIHLIDIYLNEKGVNNG
ncbi:MAG: hypothetical protein NTZ60_01995 [Campylobacterales bacterium]|nr:hypothetical protein [Campylobacterales bacterium]